MLEAMSRGKAIVTTSVGAQGLDAFSGSAFVVTDHPASFAHAVVSVLGDGALRERLQDGARRAVRSLPTWDEAAASLAGCYHDLLEGPVGGRGPLATAGGSAT